MALLFSLTGLSALAAAPDSARTELEGIPPGDVRRIAELMKARLEETSGHPIRCVGKHLDCIEGYDKLLAYDWKSSQLAPGSRIVVSPRHATGAHPNHYVINTRESPQRLQELLGATLETSAGLALEMLSTLRSRPAEPDCPGADPGLHTPKPRACPDRQEFYRDLLKSGRLDITVVRGFHDLHKSDFMGYLLEQFLKFKKVPVKIRREEELTQELIATLQQDGFQISKKSPTEWELSRDFTFDGEKKTAVVHLLASTARCANETPDEKGIVYRYDDDFCPEQAEATRKATQAFKNAFGKSQIIVYDGHTRLGRGPDFGPLGRKDGKFPVASGALDGVDLDGAKTFLFLTSCNSVKYFEEGVTKKQKTMKRPGDLIFLGTTNSNEWGNGAQEVFSLINGVMNAKCPDALIEDLNLPKPAGGDYDVVTSEISDWINKAQGTKPLTSAPKYVVAIGGPDQQRHCYEAGTGFKKPVSDMLCAFGYSGGHGTDGKRYCFLLDKTTGVYGSPIDPKLCSGQGTFRTGHPKYQFVVNSEDQSRRCFATDANGVPSDLVVENELCRESRSTELRYAVKNGKCIVSNRPTHPTVADHFCAAHYVLAPGPDGTNRCSFADEAGRPFGSPQPLRFCIK